MSNWIHRDEWDAREREWRTHVEYLKEKLEAERSIVRRMNKRGQELSRSAIRETGVLKATITSMSSQNAALGEQATSLQKHLAAAQLSLPPPTVTVQQSLVSSAVPSKPSSPQVSSVCIQTSDCVLVDKAVQAVAPMTDLGSACSPVNCHTSSGVGIQTSVGEPVMSVDCVSSTSTVVPLVSSPIISSSCSVVGSEGPVVTSKVAHSHPQVRVRIAPRMVQQPSLTQHWFPGSTGSGFHRVHSGAFRVPTRLFRDAAVRCVPTVPTVWVTVVSGWIPLQTGFYRSGTYFYSPHSGG